MVVFKTGKCFAVNCFFSGEISSERERHFQFSAFIVGHFIRWTIFKDSERSSLRYDTPIYRTVRNFCPNIVNLGSSETDMRWQSIGSKRGEMGKKRGTSPRRPLEICFGISHVFTSILSWLDIQGFSEFWDGHLDRHDPWGQNLSSIKPGWCKSWWWWHWPWRWCTP